MGGRDECRTTACSAPQEPTNLQFQAIAVCAATHVASSSQARIILRMAVSDEVAVEENHKREEFDTALARIRHEIKGRLVPHGFFGSVTYKDVEAADHVLSGSKIEITVNGRTVERAFSRQEIEACRLRVGGVVLLGVISMVDDLSA